MSYDKFNTKADQTYRITREFREKDGTVNLHLREVAAAFGPLILNDFPEVEGSVRMYQRSLLFNYREKVFQEKRVIMAEETLFDVFSSVELIQGNPKTALAEPFTAIITPEIAEKYFGSKNPVGEFLQFTDEKFNLKITGVMKPLPANSSIQTSIFISFKTLYDDRIYGAKSLLENFGNNSFSTFILLPEKYPYKKLEAQFPAFLDKHMGKDTRKWTSLYLQKLTDIHLHSAHLGGSDGNIKYVLTFTCIAFLILIIACVNFINMSTAQAAGRAKEVGIRKVSGALRGQLIYQFLAESFVTCTIALFLAGLMAIAILPQFNLLIEKNLSILQLDLTTLIIGFFMIVLFVGLASGAYPAFFLSRFNPIAVLKGKLSSGSRNTWLRKSLVTFQFTITIILIVATIVIFRQLNFMQIKELGYNKDQVICMTNYRDLTPNYKSFKEELENHPSIEKVALSNLVPSDGLSNTAGGIKTVAGDKLVETAIVNSVKVDYDFIPVYEFELLAGRNFSRDYSLDDSLSFIINESSMNAAGFKSPEEAMGKSITYGQRNGQIIGVVKDVFFESLHNPIVPLIYFIEEDWDEISIKFSAQNSALAITHLEKTWKKYLPHRPFEYVFLNDAFGRLYKAEEIRGKIFTLFSIFSIFIASLGLLGLVSFSVNQRVKEIGIRRILGANISNIVSLISKDFLKLVIFSNLIAWPIAYYTASVWLQDFAYRIELEWWYFVSAGILALMLAFLILSLQSVKAAVANPVKSLRSE